MRKLLTKLMMGTLLNVVMFGSTMAQAPPEDAYCLQVDVVKGHTIKMDFMGSGPGTVWVVKGDMEHIEVEGIDDDWNGWEEYNVSGNNPWIKIYATNLKRIKIKDNGNDGDILGADFSQIPSSLFAIHMYHSGYLTACQYNQMFHSLPYRVGGGFDYFYLTHNDELNNGALHCETAIATDKGWNVRKYNGGPPNTISFEGDGSGCDVLRINDCSGAAEIFPNELPRRMEFELDGRVNNGFIKYSDYGGPTGEGMVNGLWYKFTPSVSGEYLIYGYFHHSYQYEDPIDQEISIFKGSSCGYLQYVTHQDNNQPEEQLPAKDNELLTVNLTAGTTYYINNGYNSLDSYGSFDEPESHVMHIIKKEVPSNDACSNAININLNSLPYERENYSACGATNNNGFVGEMNDGVWYKFTPAYSGSFKIEVRSIDMDLAWFEAVGIFKGTCNNLTLVQKETPSYGELVSFTTNYLEGGTTYYLNIGHQSGTEDKPEYPFSLKIEEVIPINDQCSNAFVIESNSLPYTTTQDASKATNPEIWGNPGGEMTDGVWYQFTPTQTAAYEIKATSFYFDTYLGIIYDDCDADHYMDNEHPSGTALRNLEAGKTYYFNIGVDAQDQDEEIGVFTFSIKKATPPAGLPSIMLTLDEHLPVNLKMTRRSSGSDYVWVQNGTDNYLYEYVSTNTPSDYKSYPVINTDKLIVYGNELKEFDCAGNGDKILYIECSEGLTNLEKIDCSNNIIESLDIANATNLKHLYCHDNQLDDLGITSAHNLYCSLPERSGLPYGKLFIANTTTDSDHATILASNAENARNKNWEVWYYGNGNGSINENDVLTTGTYICGQVEVTGITVSPASTGIVVGNTKQLTANVQPANATNQNVTWSSNNNGVATVNNNGLVTALSVGNAIISATTQDGNFTAICNVTVENNTVAVTGVSINPGNITLDINTTGQLTATVAPANATNTNVTWSSNDNNIATVNANGLVTAVAPGNAIITVTTADGGFTATCNVTVNNTDGIYTEEDNNNLMLYPNPVSGLLNIESNTTILKIEVFNFLGQLIDAVNTNNNTYQYNTEKLNNGYYMFKVHTDNGTAITKVIKQ